MNLGSMKAYHQASPYRIFVLEDDLELGALIEHVLRSIDSRVHLDWATNADWAMAELNRAMVDGTSFPYDLIVADIFLEGKTTGIDFWRTCQELFPDVPVLVTSALSLDRFFSTVGRQSICPPYLQKPFTTRECKQVFESMLRFGERETRATSGRSAWGRSKAWNLGLTTKGDFREPS